MKIALIQQHATEDLEGNLRRGIENFRHAAEAGARIIAFAELAFLPFIPQFPAGPDATERAEPIPGRTTQLFSELAREYGVVTVLNLFEKEGAKTFDASPVIDTDGSLLGITRMAHIMEGPGFFEKGYYTPGGNLSFVYKTKVGKIGVAICYDRHFPEYMRNLALQGAELVFVPQAGAVDEWPPGVFEAELQVAAFQNGYFAALVNRVGKEEVLEFSGESYVVDPWGRILAQAPRGEDHILYAECDLNKIPKCPAKSHFFRDRRPDLYRKMNFFD